MTNVEFFRWLRDWDPVCQIAHEAIYASSGPVVPLCASGFPAYTRGQAQEIGDRCDAVRTSGRGWQKGLGWTRLVEITLLGRLILAAYDGTAHDVADLTDRLRESQVNVRLPMTETS